MKNIISKLAITAVALVVTAQVSQAVPISGSIGFTGQASYDTGSVGTANEVTHWFNTAVNGTSGSFDILALNSPATLFSPWAFDTTTPINDFWTAGGFSFELLSSSIITQGPGFVFVTGTGIVSGPAGYDATTFDWNFSSQGNPVTTGSPLTWTFSASSDHVPDGSTTLVLLGSALSGLALLKRKFVA
jgi:hypothetical protein